MKEKDNKKVLFVASVAGHINVFHIEFLKWFKSQGYEVHVATSNANDVQFADKKHEICFNRLPINLKNIKAYNKLKKIIREEKYDIIHCHTPTAGVITRLAARKNRKKGTKVIYTAHGFHFYKGAPLLNWIIYYPIEKWMSRYTDCLITITQEDYELARKKFRKAKKVEHVKGVGFKANRLDINMTKTEKIQFRETLKIKANDIVLSYIAELNENKNQILLIKAIKEIKKDMPNVKLLLIGRGPLKEYYSEYIKKEELQENIILLGQREDIGKLLSITDIYVASSLREGLPVNIMEAMYMGLPIVATDNRGHRELIENEKNGYIIESAKDEKSFCKRIVTLVQDKNLCKKFEKESKQKIGAYELEKIIKEMSNIYE